MWYNLVFGAPCGRVVWNLLRINQAAHHNLVEQFLQALSSAVLPGTVLRGDLLRARSTAQDCFQPLIKCHSNLLRPTQTPYDMISTESMPVSYIIEQQVADRPAKTYQPRHQHQKCTYDSLLQGLFSSRLTTQGLGTAIASAIYWIICAASQGLSCMFHKPVCV
jgi:hypothetical protein